MPGPAFKQKISKADLSLPEKGYITLIDMFTVKEVFDLWRFNLWKKELLKE